MTEFSVLVRIGLLVVRPAMLVSAAPLLGSTALLPQVKVALALLIAVVIAPAVTIAGPITGLTLVTVIAREMAIGLALALVVRALIAGAEMAGHLAGFQIGFSYGATIDPVSGVRNTAVATLYGMIATITLFGINAHHMLLRALAASYTHMPIGQGQVHPSLLDGIRDTLGLVFVLGLRLAAPLLIVLLIVEVAIGLIARSAPALNMMVIGYGARLIVGMTVLAAVIATVPGIVSSFFESTLALGVRLAAGFR